MLRSATLLDNSNDKSSPKPDDHSFLKAQRWAIISPGPSSRLCRELRTLCPTSSALWYFKSWNLIARPADGPLKCPFFCFHSKQTASERTLCSTSQKNSQNTTFIPADLHRPILLPPLQIKTLKLFFSLSNTNATRLKTNPKVFCLFSFFQKNNSGNTLRLNLPRFICLVFSETPEVDLPVRVSYIIYAVCIATQLWLFFFFISKRNKQVVLESGIERKWIDKSQQCWFICAEGGETTSIITGFEIYEFSQTHTDDGGNRAQKV